MPDDPDIVALLIHVQAAMVQALRTEMPQGSLLADLPSVIRYLRVAIGNLPVEQLWVLYLDQRCRLLCEEAAGRGSVTVAPIYPREIIRRALDVGAVGIVLAHNHPSGDPRPSRADIHATRALDQAATLMSMTVHDHLIVGASGAFSFRQEGYLGS